MRWRVGNEGLARGKGRMKEEEGEFIRRQREADEATPGTRRPGMIAGDLPTDGRCLAIAFDVAKFPMKFVAAGCGATGDENGKEQDGE